MERRIASLLAGITNRKDLIRSEVAEFSMGVPRSRTSHSIGCKRERATAEALGRLLSAGRVLICKGVLNGNASCSTASGAAQRQGELLEMDAQQLCMLRFVVAAPMLLQCCSCGRCFDGCFDLRRVRRRVRRRRCDWSSRCAGAACAGCCHGCSHRRPNHAAGSVVQRMPAG